MVLALALVLPGAVAGVLAGEVAVVVEASGFHFTNTRPACEQGQVQCLSRTQLGRGSTLHA